MVAAGEIAKIAVALVGQSLADRLVLIRDRLDGRIVFTTSFGLEDQAISHAILTQSVAIELATLDTGRLFPETYEVWANTERRYGVRIGSYAPERPQLESLVAEQGIDGFRLSVGARKSCCGVRKVGPLARALAGASAWVTGLRAEQSQERAATPLVATEPGHDLVKINPLADWSRADVARYVTDNAVPYNRLHDRGYLSIGCAPCTRAVQPGEPERAGRWWWERDDKRECGLHDRFTSRLPAESFFQDEVSP